MADMRSDARVVIKVDVNDTEASAKLSKLGQRLRSLNGSGKSTTQSFNGTNKALTQTAKNAGRLSKSVGDLDDKFNFLGRRAVQFKKDMNGAGTALRALGAAMSAVGKIVMYGALGFGAATVALGAMTLAFKAGQLAARGWNIAVQGVAGAAGVAVASIATVLGAIRELQVAQMKPLYTGPLTLAKDMSSLMGNKRLAMFSDSLQAIAAEQMRATGRVDALFQQRLTRMADFAMGDPKTLQSISAAFSLMQKEGKVTTDVYAQLQEASPALAQAFEEMAGGQKQAASAAEQGKISFTEFNNAMMEGKLKALEPFNGALDAINNTLIGQLKGSLVSIKEDLTQMGVGFVDMFKGPLAQAEQDIETFILQITPTLQKSFPQLFDRIAGDANGLLGGVLDKLAASIARNMPKLVGMGNRLGEVWADFRQALRDINGWLETAVGPFETMYNAVLRPLGQELIATLSYALAGFKGMVDGNSAALYGMGNALRGIFEGVRGFIDVLLTLKQILQPFIVGLMKFLSLLGQVFSADNFIGAMLRFVAVGGVLALLFKKFIVSLGMMKQNAVGFGQALMNLFTGQKSVQAATDSASQAAQKQTAAVNGTTAAMERMLLVMQEILYIQRQMAGIPAFGSMTAGRFVMPAGVSAKMAAQQQQAIQSGIAMPLSAKPVGPVALSSTSAARTAERTGRAMGRGFAESKMGKTITGMGVGVGMIAPLLGSFVSGKADSTNNGMQALGGALTMGGTGAMIGSMFGPWGTLIGGLGGALVGGISGWLGADKEQERRTESTRELVGSKVSDALGTGNRLSDYVNARNVIKQGEQELRFMREGGKSNIARLEKERDLAVSSVMTEFLDFVGPLAQKEFGLQAGGKMRQLGEGFQYEYMDPTYGSQVQNLGDFESNFFEDAARMFAQQRYGISEGDALAAVTGKGGSKNVLFLKEIVAGRYNDEIAATNKELERLAAEYGDLDAASNKYREELERVNKAQVSFNRNMDDAVYGLGLNADEVSALFDELGYSLSETGVGISEFNKLIGYTGDSAADMAVAVGRLRDSLVAPLEQERMKAETANALEQQLTAWFETRGTSMTGSDMTIMAADTMTALLDSILSRYLSGEMTFDQAFGQSNIDTAGMPRAEAARAQLDDDGGVLGRQIQALLSQSPDLDPYLVQLLKNNADAITNKIDEMNTNPFERAKFDPAFAERFTTAMNGAAAQAFEMIDTKGVDAGTALDTAALGLETFLKEEGIKVTPQTLEQMSTTLGNTVLNSSTAIQNAHYLGAQEVSRKIREALAGGVRLIPSAGGGTPKQDTATPRDGRFGDSATARFRQTMVSHSMLNRRFGGKRAVTSGIRDWGIGSLNSDHTTGAAFDLTGDNLLSYGKAVRDTGGFAEIHGGPSERHLHVVPNVGDSYSPRPMASQQAAAAGSTGGPITVNVYGAEGQSVQALANEVVARLDRRERSMRERS